MTPRDTTKATQEAVTEKVDGDQERGYCGVKVDPRPNSDWSLASGPDSPPAIEDPEAPIPQHSIGKVG